MDSVAAAQHIERSSAVLDELMGSRAANRVGVAAVAGRAVANPPVTSWPAPLPLLAAVARVPYPLDALPVTVRAAVEEVKGFVKAPTALVASSALGAISVAVQAHADVKRAEKLEGPSSLFLLSIADSGERKTTCDGFFTATIHEYEREQADLAEPVLSSYRADYATWEAKRAGLIEAIKLGAKARKDTGEAEAQLRTLESQKPAAPLVPSLIRGDDTPENLAWVLASRWPSAGVISSEAGVVFGSHGMGKDSLMRNLSLLNVLWDGGELSIGRRSSESFTVRGARLTVALQVQAATLRTFFERSGGLARGTGFLARFLIAWPESTQGSRPFSEAPKQWPAVAVFSRRIREVLEQPAPVTDNCTLSPALMIFSPEAKAAWVKYHDAVESELCSGGELHDVRDIASKSADNASRLAALFHVFSGAVGPIGLDCFEGASRIAAWHLNEARRLFGELTLPQDTSDTARLDGWLLEHCRRDRVQAVRKNHVRQHGPLRDGARLDSALRELAELGRVRLTDNKPLTVHINPQLLGENMS